jgi:hypothetical protein
MMLRKLRVCWALLLVAVSFGALALPAGALSPGTAPFARTWEYTDYPVQAVQASRTWMWGPFAFSAAMEEPYEEGPFGGRVVQYYDKTRMEISTDPNADPNSIWYVTNGLLAKELVTGEMQLGDNFFEPWGPAEVNVAGDPDDSTGPTYATFGLLLGDSPLAVGAAVIQRVDREGNVTDDPGFAGAGVTAATFVPETNHTVASPFWTFMNSSGTVYQNGGFQQGQLFQNAFFATGFPITEAFWAYVKVAGIYVDVLIQVFERRVLTYTPGNPAGWQVEAGNVGQHYYQWRYDTAVPGEPPGVDLPNWEPIGPTLLPTWPAALGAQALVSIGNQAPYPMTVSLDGPVSMSFTLDACPDCVIYSSPNEVTSCRADIDWEDVTLPPGNYRIQITWGAGATVESLAGPQTYVPDAAYGSCYFIVEANT